MLRNKIHNCIVTSVSLRLRNLIMTVKYVAHIGYICHSLELCILKLSGVMLNLHIIQTFINSICMKAIGALFDLDGVLIDSETSYTAFWQNIDSIYPTGIDNYAIAIKGTTLPEIMKHYDDENVKADILKRIHDFQETMVYEIYDGVIGFLNELRGRGIRSAIVTSSDSRKMHLLFRQHPELREAVDEVIDASMVTRSKPDPEGYLKAAGVLGCRPEDCYVFEDSLQGLKAGNASGAVVIALATTYPREILKDKAAKIIDSFVEFSVDDMLSVSRL